MGFHFHAEYPVNTVVKAKKGSAADYYQEKNAKNFER